jgi:hypothetical protein
MCPTCLCAFLPIGDGEIHAKFIVSPLISFVVDYVQGTNLKVIGV